MNKAVIQNRIARIFACAGAAAVIATLALSLGQMHSSRVREVTLSAYHAIQVVDGSESNGGKGGKGGAKRSANA